MFLWKKIPQFYDVKYLTFTVNNWVTVSKHNYLSLKWTIIDIYIMYAILPVTHHTKLQHTHVIQNQ